MARQVTHVTVRNGLTLAYVVALVNALMAVLLSFGVHMTNDQIAAITGLVNAAMLLSARVLHLPEKTPDGGTVKITHVPVLKQTSADGETTTVTPSSVTEG